MFLTLNVLQGLNVVHCPQHAILDDHGVKMLYLPVNSEVT